MKVLLKKQRERKHPEHQKQKRNNQFENFFNGKLKVENERQKVFFLSQITQNRYLLMLYTLLVFTDLQTA